jgi:hypothetical protein
VAEVGTAMLALEGGGIALIDSADVDLVAGFRWRQDANGYVSAWRGQFQIYLHRLIAGAGTNQRVDHENENKLDNRTSNLRFASAAQNRANAGPNRKTGRTSRYKGVSWKSERAHWVAYIHIDGRTRYLGSFADESAAADAYDTAARAAWGDFARLNNAERGSAVTGEPAA